MKKKDKKSGLIIQEEDVKNYYQPLSKFDGSLFYLRQIPTFEILGMLFGVSKSEANVTFHYWIKIFRVILPSSLIEQVENKQGDLMIVQEILTTFKLLVDSLEQHASPLNGGNPRTRLALLIDHLTTKSKKSFIGERRNNIL